MALRRVADVLTRHSRAGDLVARLGGDEFALCLDNMTGESALKWGETLLEAAGALADLSGSREKPLGFSIGVAIYRGGGGEALQDVVNRADATMYEVKRAGKGLVRLAADPPPGPAKPDRRA
jgi:diguanylate cyclase (GGDEF)-like protein